MVSAGRGTSAAALSAPLLKRMVSDGHWLTTATQDATPLLLVPVFVVPFGHATQLRSTVAVPVPSATYVPAAHTVIAMHCARVALPVAALNVLAGQAVHTRSSVADGVFDTYVPIGQPVHGWHAAVALVIGWKVPATHALHTRSEVAVGCAVT
jgi:hypothetical protein